MSNPVSKFTQPGQISPLLQYSPEGILVGVNFETPAEAKLAIKEIKLKKREFQLEKKEVSAQITQIRADHRSEKIARGPAIRGRGTFMNVLKTVDRVSRHSAAATVDEAVRELEAKKSRIDQNINELDRVVLQLEKYILENS